MNTITQSDTTRLEEGRTYTFELSSGRSLPVRWSCAPLREVQDAVLIDRLARLDVLWRLDDYPYLCRLLDADCLDHARQHKIQVRQWLSEGIYVFGAYKIGLKLARLAQAAGLMVKNFLDNDRTKQGCMLEGIPVFHPSELRLENAVVLIASGHHSNAIHVQLKEIPGIRLVNMSEFLYSLDAPHGAGDFIDFVEAPVREPFRYISTFLRMDDEHSRQVFDKLIGMRINLSTALADSVKSPWGDEYFDAQFVDSLHAMRFVDAGAAAGDTLQRLESLFGSVEQAWLFEPELPAYYEALKHYAARAEVWLFNMGLDEVPSRATYRPDLSYDFTNEMESSIPAGVASYIQGVPLDAVVSGRVGLFKLDIEGMEARALRGLGRSSREIGLSLPSAPITVPTTTGN